MAKDAAKTAPVAKTPNTKTVETTATEDLTMVYVRAVNGDMRHLFTNVVFDKNPKKVQIDGFLQSQIDAGKLEVVQP